MINEIEDKLLKLRKMKPLVLNFTNYVSMDFMANCLLALGAAPIMSVCDEELEELVEVSSSININIGTLDKAFLSRCKKVIEFAKSYQKPIIFDPVGSGASLIRTQIAREILSDIDILRANASEIISLSKNNTKTLGVESVNSTEEAKDTARELSSRYHCTVIVSGAIDYISNGEEELEINFGSDLMPLVTGMGCSLTAVVAAFRAVNSDDFESAKMATQYFGLCGMIARTKSHHPGSFRTEFIDALHYIDFKKMKHFICDENNFFQI